MTTLNEWFEKGVPAADFVASMRQHKENLESIYEKFNVSTEDVNFFQSLRDQNIRVIVITEDWCGDAMMNTPILLRIAEAANMEVRMIPRDKNLELMDQYLTNGTARSIPIFIFMDENGEEKTMWGPRAASVQEFAMGLKVELPAKEAPEFEDAQKRVIAKITEAYKSDRQLWNEVYDSLKATLATIR